MNLTPKQRAFADFYIELGNATEAARRAGYSAKTAKSIGAENLTKPDIKIYIARRQEKIESERTASLKEIQELRTAIMRGQEKDQFGIETSIADRLRAAGDLEKSLRIKEEQETKAAARASAHYELPARVIGRAFVDINRRIQPNMTYVFEGGRGGLKSSYISLKIVELLKNNPTMHACIIRKMGNTLKDSVYAQMKWAINELGLYDEFNCKLSPLEIVLKETGQTIYFRGCDDPLKLKSIKPPFGYIGILWKEEKDQLCGPEEERSINQSVLRGGADSYDFSSYNPPKSKSSWVNKERLVPNPGRVFHHSSYTEAPPEWLGAKFISDAEHLKEVNPAAYEHEYEGVANGDGGSVLTIWNSGRSQTKRFHISTASSRARTGAGIPIRTASSVATTTATARRCISSQNTTSTRNRTNRRRVGSSNTAMTITPSRPIRPNRKASTITAKWAYPSQVPLKARGRSNTA